MSVMSEIVLRFSESVLLSSAKEELARHQSSLRPISSATPKPRVIADLSGLKEIDTSALAVILQLDRDVRQATGSPMVIRSAPENLISLARLSSLLPVLCWEGAAIK